MPRPCGLEFRTTDSHPVFNYFQPGDVPANTGIADAALVAPELAPLLPLFNRRRLATMLNVGTLVQPTTEAQ